MNNECNQNKHFFSRGFNANITIHYSKKTFCNASCLLLYEMTFLIIVLARFWRKANITVGISHLQGLSCSFCHVHYNWFDVLCQNSCGNIIGKILMSLKSFRFEFKPLRKYWKLDDSSHGSSQKQTEELTLFACRFCFPNTDHVTIPRRVFSFKVKHFHACMQSF